MIVAMSKQGTAIIYYDETFAKQSGLPYTTKFETIPEGSGNLKTDLDKIWWEDNDIPQIPTQSSDIEQLRADVDYLAVMNGVTL